MQTRVRSRARARAETKGSWTGRRILARSAPASRGPALPGGGAPLSQQSYRRRLRSPAPPLSRLAPERNVRLLTTVTITAKQKSCKNKGRETTPPGQKHLYFRGHDSIEIHRRLVYYNLGHLHGLLRHYRPLNMHNLRDLLHNDLPRARASRPAPGGRQGGAGRGARGAGRALSTVTGTSFSTSFSI